MKTLVLMFAIFFSTQAFAGNTIFFCKSSAAADAMTVVVGPINSNGCFGGRFETFGWKNGTCSGSTSAWRNCDFSQSRFEAEGECGAHGSCSYVSLSKNADDTWGGNVIMIGRVTCKQYVSP